MSSGKSALAGLAAAGLALCFGQAALAAEGLREVCGECRFEKVATCGGFLEGATVSPDGALWVMDVSGNRVLEIRDGQCINRGEGGGLPNGAKFLSDGRLLIANSQGLVSFDTQTAEITPIVTEFEGEPLRSPNDLTLDANGGIYLTEVRGASLFNPIGRVLYFPPDGGEAQLLADGLAFPNGITISGDGRNILVSEFLSQRIIAISAPTAVGGLRVSYVFGYTSGGVGADGIFVGEKGRLFTAQLGAGMVQVFSEQGQIIGDITLPQEAGMMATNFATHNGYLYITEAELGEIWRIKMLP